MKREILKLKVRPRRHFPFSHALDEAVHCILEVITLVGIGYNQGKYFCKYNTVQKYLSKR